MSRRHCDLTEPQLWRGGIQVDRASDRVPLIALSAETLLMLRTSPRREVSDSAGARILLTATLTLTQELPPSRALCYVNSCLLLYTAQELFLVDERQECVIVAAAPRICHHAFHSLEFR